MIDFVKILVKDMHPYLLEDNHILNFCEVVNTNTGEIRTTNKQGYKITPYKNAYYKGLEFKIYENNTITIEGSLHKYWNSGGHNYNDFDKSALKDVLNELNTLFKLNLNNCILRCVEVGVNVEPPQKTNEILKQCFLHKNKSFEYKYNSDEGKYLQCRNSQYIIKLYNKALHYKSKGFKIDSEIMRFEIKYTKMKRLNQLGIATLNDLLDFDFELLKTELLKEWNNVLFYDNTIQSNSKRLLNYNNPTYWTGLIENSRNNFDKHKRIYKEIVINNSDRVQNQISQIIEKKCTELNSRGMKNYHLYIGENLVPHPQENNPNKTQNLNRFCSVTGLNISMQKGNSKLLSHTGLKYYYQTDKKVFNEVKRKYLSSKWINSEYEIQIKEIAHNIRNYNTNRNNRLSKTYPANQLNLFDISNIRLSVRV